VPVCGAAAPQVHAATGSSSESRFPFPSSLRCSTQRTNRQAASIGTVPIKARPLRATLQPPHLRQQELAVDHDRLTGRGVALGQLGAGQARHHLLQAGLGAAAALRAERVEHLHTHVRAVPQPRGSQ
jgi:hypothetical protein